MNSCWVYLELPLSVSNQLDLLKSTGPSNRGWLASKMVGRVGEVTSSEPKLGKTLAGGHMLTSTLPSSSCCGAGRAWPAALLWLWLRELGSQSQALTPLSAVLVGSRVRCTRNLGLTFKCWDEITTDDREEEKEEGWINCEFCLVAVTHDNKQKITMGSS